jgi:hypothetical protein
MDQSFLGIAGLTIGWKKLARKASRVAAHHVLKIRYLGRYAIACIKKRVVNSICNARQTCVKIGTKARYANRIAC